MATNKDGKLQKINVRLWLTDLEYLRQHFPDNYNGVVRRIIGNWVRRDKGRKHGEQEEN